jgi:hypothetical protein
MGTRKSAVNQIAPLHSNGTQGNIDMTDIDWKKLEADREAGTPGPWFARETYVHDKHVWYDAEGARHGDTPNVAFDCEEETDARRIARLPALEAYALAAREKLEAAEELVRALEPYAALAKHHAADAPEWGPFDSVTAQVSILYLRNATEALAAYRAAGEGEE